MPGPESLALEPLPDTAVTLKPPPSRPGSEGFARTFARYNRPSVRHLLPGRRVWLATFLAGSLATAVVFAPDLFRLLHVARQAGRAPAAAHPAPHAPATPDPSSTANAASTANASYTAWAGPGCPAPDGGGYREENRDDSNNAWYTVKQGGLTDNGCDGSFTAVPMSGDPNQDGNGRAVWWWSVGDAQNCDLAVYVPDDANNNDVGGHPTTYAVLSDPNSEDSKYDTFQVEQADNTGKPVPAGPFQVHGGQLAVMLLDRGDNNWAEGVTPHHAAAQIQITCHNG
ncbi:adhesin [Streptomyces lunalinharesii]|uniref:Adhesin n=1 Tax=Streptomyces lunalinharesii TaxID=333384 RepID=A0ABN3SLT8_9ACTN